MTLIPFPNVPAYPGVPPIPRIAPGVPTINIPLANSTTSSPVANGSAVEMWGIAASDTDTPLYIPTQGGILSFVSFSFARQMEISDFPLEADTSGQGATFASYNKVWTPGNPVLVLALAGTASEQAELISAIEVACESTNLYSVITPDGTYGDYSIESYNYQRTAQRNATMLTVEISLKEILQVQPAYSNPAEPSPINSPQSPSASSQVNNGSTQAQLYTGSTSGVLSMVGGPE